MAPQWIWGWMACVCITLYACGESTQPRAQQHENGNERTEQIEGGLSIDPATGIPFAYTFRHPIEGFDADDYGFGFGLENRWFCMSTAPDNTCASYGIHLGRDTAIAATPQGTRVRAPADGIVRITTDIRFGGYGSDNAGNQSYSGCVVVLEHLLGTGEAVTTLLGHLACDSGPDVGTLVTRGDVIGRVGNYWHGTGTSTNWHHVHWAMRKGRFRAAAYKKNDLLPYVKGYAPIGEFSVDSTTGALVHPQWIDPFLILATRGESGTFVDQDIRHHPSGSFLQDPDGTYWMVQSDTTVAKVPSGIARSSRYATGDAIPVTHEEIGCYDHAPDAPYEGLVTLYVRPGTNAVVMAYHDTKERYDLITWEALLSWGFQEGDISQGVQASFFEEEYADRGFRLLRPGTLVKASNASEVSLVTAQQTRLPIQSEDVFERAGFQWNRIMTVPASSMNEVAGPRESRVLTEDDLFQCAVSQKCPEGSAPCGGGALPEEPEEQEPEPQPEPVEQEPEPNVQQPLPESTPTVPSSTPEPVVEAPSSTPEPESVSTPDPTVSVPLTITVKTLLGMNDFSLWLLSGAFYATGEDTAEDCVRAAKSAVCTVDHNGAEPLEFWMYTGVPNTPWSPGLNWETNACDPFATVSAQRGETPVPLQMIQVGDGCHFLLEGE